MASQSQPPSELEWSASSAGPASFSTFTRPIQKSPQDDREYRVIKLANGLQAMLVHDAKADKAAASLDVAVGHLYDPDDMPGLAHFCEHLLFMGTELFPRENEYSEFLAKNNGSSNAYTGTSNTNYYFSVSTDALPGALARFAGFFHCPLFTPSCTSRELNAVDSEHKKNHQNDVWRIFQVNKHLSKDGHPWRKFGSGNRDSLSQVGRDLKAKISQNGTVTGENGSALKINGNIAVNNTATSSPDPSSEMEGDGGVVGRETRRRLIEWWSKEYCASRMRLCVVGKESLDDLAAMVTTLFSPIQNRGQEPLPEIPEHPFGPNEKGTLVSVQTIMSFHVLELSFPIAYQPPLWRYQPAHFLAHFLGHEGPGSLHSYLKNKGWLTALSAGPQNLARGFAMFKVTLHLTQEGFDNYRQAMLAIFKYLSLLRSSSFPSWNQREMSIIKQTRFRFSEKRRPDDYAVWISEHMAWPVPRDLILSAPQLVQEWDERDPENGGEREVREILDSLRVENGRALLMAQPMEHERVGPKNAVWEHEPWYGTPYRVERFDEQFVKQAQGPNDIAELYLPGPNEFIPTNLNVDKREVEKPSKRPYLIRETPLSTLWHKKDDQFWVPKAHVIMEMRTPVANASARTSVMTRLYSDLVTDSLTEFSYDADLAGLSYNFASGVTGLYMTVTGYNDKLPVLAKDILEKARSLRVDPARLEVIKEQVKRDWENFFLGQPYRLADYFGRYLMTSNQWTITEKLAEISSITAEEVQTHMANLLSRLHMRTLVVGNMYKDDAIRLVETAEGILQASPVPAVVEKALVLPDGSENIWAIPVPNKNEPNSSLTYYTHLGSFLDPRVRVTSALLSQILSEPAFNVLRTREQLGYIVSLSQWTLAGDSEVGLRIVVQSERHPAYLEGRVEAFLDEMKDKLQEMSEAELEEQKAGLVRKWTEAVKNMYEETNRYWAQIESGYLDFFRREQSVELVKTITKEDVLALFLTRVHPSSSARAKLSVHIQSQKPRPQTVSLAAMEAFERAVAAHTTVDGSDWKQELSSDGEPSLEQFTKYWQDKLRASSSPVSPQIIDDLFAGLPVLLKEHPSRTESEDMIETRASFIKDPKAFKATLRETDPPKPAVDWPDLPTSHL